MTNNVRIAKELMRIAKSLIAGDNDQLVADLKAGKQEAFEQVLENKDLLKDKDVLEALKDGLSKSNVFDKAMDKVLSDPKMLQIFLETVA